MSNLRMNFGYLEGEVIDKVYNQNKTFLNIILLDINPYFENDNGQEIPISFSSKNKIFKIAENVNLGDRITVKYSINILANKEGKKIWNKIWLNCFEIKVDKKSSNNDYEF